MKSVGWRICTRDGFFMAPSNRTEKGAEVVIEENTRVENKARHEWRFSRDTREKRLSSCESWCSELVKISTRKPLPDLARVIQASCLYLNKTNKMEFRYEETRSCWEIYTVATSSEICGLLKRIYYKNSSLLFDYEIYIYI